jgi:hypothetical protein
MDNFTAILLILGAFVGLPILVSYFSAQADERRGEHLRQMRAQDPNYQPPKPPPTPAWLETFTQWLFLILGIVIFIVPIIAGLITGDGRTWLWAIIVGVFFLGYSSRRT